MSWLETCASALRRIENALAFALITSVALAIGFPLWLLGLTDETDEHEEHN
jgi:hypothetical protein